VPIYLYKGYESATGKEVKGKIEADSTKAARQKLRNKLGVIPAEIKKELIIGKSKSSFDSLFQEKVSLQDVAIMTRQFATLQSAQVPLDECLTALVGQVENILLRNSLADIKEAVSEGKSLAEAMRVHDRVFDRLYVNMVKAGESAGNLNIVLERLADFQEYQIAVRGKVMGAMAYPAIMIVAAIFVIIYLFVSVVPKLQKVFDSLGVDLPWITKFLISVSEFLQYQWYIVIIALVAVFFLFRSWYRSEKGRMSFDRKILKMPIIGSIAIRVNVSTFTKTLSTLLGSGVPIIEALEITKNIIGNKCISDVVGESKIAVQEGESLGGVIEKSGQFPALVSHMIKTGEKTGELENMLQHVAKAYDAEVERKIESLIAMIEPIMILVLAGIVVIVVVALLVPMLSITSQMR
jgi:general secretion pathway protein F